MRTITYQQWMLDKVILTSFDKASYAVVFLGAIRKSVKQSIHIMKTYSYIIIELTILEYSKIFKFYIFIGRHM